MTELRDHELTRLAGAGDPAARTGHLLAWGLTTTWGRIESSTAEVLGIDGSGVTFGRSLRSDGGKPTLSVLLDIAHGRDVQVDAEGGSRVQGVGRQVAVDAYTAAPVTVRLAPQVPRVSRR